MYLNYRLRDPYWKWYLLYNYSPATYRIVRLLSFNMSATVGLCNVLGIVPQLYTVSFLSSFINMFSIIRLFPFELYPVSMPWRNCCTVYTPWFIIHAAVWLPDGVTLQNSSTFRPGWAIIVPGTCWAVTTLIYTHCKLIYACTYIYIYILKMSNINDRLWF